jgi:hypothetical protein
MASLIPFPVIRSYTFTSIIIVIWTVIVNEEGTVNANTVNNCTGMFGTVACLLIALSAAQSPCDWTETFLFMVIPLEIFFAATLVLSDLSSRIF